MWKTVAIAITLIAAACSSDPGSDKPQQDTTDTGTMPDTGGADTDDPTDGDTTATDTETDSGNEIDTEPVPDADTATCAPDASSDCVSIDPGYPDGVAICGEDGAWNVDNCYYGDEQVAPFGVLLAEPEVKINYLLDGNRMEDQMYLLQHQLHIMPKAVFHGDVDGTAFPPTGGTIVNMTYGWHVETDGQGQILVLQYSGRGMSPVNPMIQLLFLTDELRPGTYRIGRDVFASLIDLDEKTESQCVKAVAYGGSVVITAAADTQNKQGGNLSYLLPHDIHLYKPTDTTFGDLADTFEGIEVCP